MGWWKAFSHLPGGEVPSAEGLGACWRNGSVPCLPDNPAFCSKASGQPIPEKLCVSLSKVAGALSPLEARKGHGFASKSKSMEP